MEAVHMELKNFDSWMPYDGMPEGSGRSEKEWIQSPDGLQIGLFKYPKCVNGKPSTTEYVSEHLAYKLGELLGVPTARVDIGCRDGRIGCISYLLTDGSWQTLIEGIHFILTTHPEYDAEKLVDNENGCHYCLDHLYEVGNGSLWGYWVQMMLFDFLIGNSDRHQSNWGLLAAYPKEAISQKRPIPVKPCPLYDNGSSLCSSINEDQVERYLGKDRMAFEALVDSKSKSLIRIDGRKAKKPRHSEMVRYLLDEYEETYPIAKRFTVVLSDDVIRILLKRYPESILPSAKRELILRYLVRKREILEELMVDTHE